MKSAGSDDEQHRQRDLRDDQRARDGHAPASPPAPRPWSLIASIGATPAARNAGAVPKRSAVSHGDAARERQHAPVERQIEKDGARLRRQLLHQQLAAPARDQEPKAGAD